MRVDNGAQSDGVYVEVRWKRLLWRNLGEFVLQTERHWTELELAVHSYNSMDLRQRA